MASKKEHYTAAENLFVSIVTAQPNLMRQVRVDELSGKEIAEFMHGFIETHVKYREDKNLD
ncbi:hypothetical protein [Burkholderia pyrrocinia]|uniref:hypothetical protein n=1 Tax=Burkholderia pyrrocinia TaxID=60550 RepID=UPI002AAF74D5|nr:hypothetical protein [Burkholderia pyrrocinia]